MQSQQVQCWVVVGKVPLQADQMAQRWLHVLLRLHHCQCGLSVAGVDVVMMVSETECLTLSVRLTQQVTLA